MDTCNRKNLIICITVIGSLFFSPIELPILKTQFYTPPPSLQFLFHKNIPYLDSFLLKIVKNDKTEFLMSFCKIDGGGSYNCVFRIGQINQRYLICFGKIFSPFQEIKFSGFEPDQNTIS